MAVKHMLETAQTLSFPIEPDSPPASLLRMILEQLKTILGKLNTLCIKISPEMTGPGSQQKLHKASRKRWTWYKDDIRHILLQLRDTKANLNIALQVAQGYRILD
jgi:hypothetical protein